MPNTVVRHTFPLTIGLGLEAGNVAGEGEEIGINGFTLGLAGLRLPLRFLGSDLLMVEGNLTSTVTHVEDRTLVVGGTYITVPVSA
jgi:hypothetical protein